MMRFASLTASYENCMCKNERYIPRVNKILEFLGKGPENHFLQKGVFREIFALLPPYLFPPLTPHRQLGDG
jgi:hypothetical protein